MSKADILLNPRAGSFPTPLFKAAAPIAQSISQTAVDDCIVVAIMFPNGWEMLIRLDEKKE